MKTWGLLCCLLVSNYAKSQDTLSLKLIFHSLSKDSMRSIPADTIFLSSRSGVRKYSSNEIIFKGGNFFIANIPKGTYRMFVKGKENVYFRNNFYPIICSQCNKEIVLDYTVREITNGERVTEEDFVYTEISGYKMSADKKYQRKSGIDKVRHAMLTDFTKTWNKRTFKRISKKNFLLTGFLSRSKNFSDIQVNGDDLTKGDKLLLIKSFAAMTDWYFTGEFIEVSISGKELFGGN